MPTITGPLKFVKYPHATALDAVITLTDSSAGTAGTTLAAQAASVTGVDGSGSNAASKADVDAQLVIIRNSVASLARAINRLAARIQ